MHPHVTYDRLDDEVDDEKPRPSTPVSHESRVVRTGRRLGVLVNIWNGLLALISTTLLVVILSRYAIPLHNHASSKVDLQSSVQQPVQDDGVEWLGCGKTVEEAKALGCHYDLMLSWWVPSPCFAPELLDKYLAHGQYQFYLDKAMTQSISTSEARLGEFSEIYTKIKFHLDHCAYALELLMQSYITRGFVLKGIYSMKHAEHCANITVEQRVPGKTIATVRALFDGCGRP